MTFQPKSAERWPAPQSATCPRQESAPSDDDDAEAGGRSWCLMGMPCRCSCSDRRVTAVLWSRHRRLSKCAVQCWGRPVFLSALLQATSSEAMRAQMEADYEACPACVCSKGLSRAVHTGSPDVYPHETTPAGPYSKSHCIQGPRFLYKRDATTGNSLPGDKLPERKHVICCRHASDVSRKT